MTLSYLGAGRSHLLFDITKRKFSNKGIESRQDAKHAKFGGKS